RERPVQQVIAAVEQAVAATGFEEVSFLSLSSSDYAHIEELVDAVTERFADHHLSIGLPSLRIESFSVELLQKLEKGRRRSGFTFAPEAATDRLRHVINKPIPTDLMLETAHRVFSRGWTTIKMYFMIGHPTQTMTDVKAIAKLARDVLAVGRIYVGRKAKVRVGVSILVPKPHTAFQWVSMVEEATIWEQLDYLKRQLRIPGIHYTWSKPRESLMEAFLSKGDRRLSAVIQRAWELGAQFDAWGDQFIWAAWTQAFAESGLDMDWYARRPRSTDEVLPWDHINMGVDKDFLIREYRYSQEGAVLDDCREHCFSCGIMTTFKKERRIAQETPGEAGSWGCPGFGKDAKRQPVSRRQIPLFFDPEMSPEKMILGQFDHPVTQRRSGDASN
ncbi:MAG: B12-binding domain-containing radical SAM protein, partial [Clostridia bacterium]